MRSSGGHLLAAFVGALGLALTIIFAEAKLGCLSCFTKSEQQNKNEPEEAKPIEKLTRICKGEDVEIGSIQALRSLTGDIRKSGHHCHVNDITVLYQLIEITDGRNVCSKEKATKIAGFYRDWEGSLHRLRERLPKKRPDFLLPFNNFFLAYGLRMSALCEETMMKRLASYPMPDSDDFDDIELLYKPGSRIDSLLTPLIKSDAITLPSLVSTVLPLLGDERVLVQSDHGHIRQFEHAQKVCRLRFRPLYEHFLEPIAILAQSGFAHRSDYFEQSKSTGEFDKWTRIVFLCELLDSMQFCPDDANKGSDAGEQPDSGRNLELVRNDQREIVLRMLSTFPDDSLLSAMRTYDISKHELYRQDLFVKLWITVVDRYEAEGRLGALVDLIGETQRNEDDAKLSRLKEDMDELTKDKGLLRIGRQPVIVGDDLYRVGAPGRWIMKAAIAGRLLPPGTALYPLGPEPASDPAALNESELGEIKCKINRS
jgi:hypothetical protein